MKSFTLFLILFSFTCVIYAQAKDERGYYLVEAEKFTPPVKAMIKSFEGHVAEGFLAPDIYGEEHYLNNFRGKPTFLFFWNIEDEKGREVHDYLAEINSDAFQIIGMASNKKNNLLTYYDGTTSPFIVIPNADVFGQMAYGQDLGFPRIFALDASGIIQQVLPACLFKTDNYKEVIEETIQSLQ